MEQAVTLIICRGNVGSGKSTWAEAYLREELLKGNVKVMIVSRDALRKAAGLGVEPTKYESAISMQEQALLRAGLKADYTVISTNMNLRAQYVKGMAATAAEFGRAVEIKDFDVPLEVCIQRDKLRAEFGGHFVGEDFIRQTHKKFFAQGFPKNPIGSIEAYVMHPYIRDIEKPKVKIFDIDGTLANHLGQRSPYDYDKVHLDLPHKDVIAEMVDAWEHGYKVIALSGREDSCYPATVQWLREHTGLPVATDTDEEGYECNIPLFMRKTGDSRTDWIVKYELFKTHVEPYYDVQAVYDDRDQVVRMWREIGLRCYQVNFGAF